MLSLSLRLGPPRARYLFPALTCLVLDDRDVSAYRTVNGIKVCARICVLENSNVEREIEFLLIGEEGLRGNQNRKNDRSSKNAQPRK